MENPTLGVAWCARDANDVRSENRLGGMNVMALLLKSFCGCGIAG